MYYSPTTWSSRDEPTVLKRTARKLSKMSFAYHRKKSEEKKEKKKPHGGSSLNRYTNAEECASSLQKTLWRKRREKKSLLKERTVRTLTCRFRALHQRRKQTEWQPGVIHTSLSFLEFQPLCSMGKNVINFSAPLHST